MAIKLIVVDLDGTLLNRNSKIHPKNLEMINRVYQKKPEVKIVIATGRSPSSALNYAKKILTHKKSEHIICYNGGSIINISGENGEQQTKIFDSFLTKEQVQKIFNFAKEYKLNFWAYNTDNKTAYIHRYSLKVWLTEIFNKVKAKKFKENQDVSVYKILLFCKKKQVPIVLNKLKETKELELVVSAHSVIEVNPIGINKASAVQFLAKKWDIKAEEILACGDGMNDYEMLKWVGYGIAMGNGTDELKKIAFDVTDTNNKAGVAKAINKYLFLEKNKSN